MSPRVSRLSRESRIPRSCARSLQRWQPSPRRMRSEWNRTMKSSTVNPDRGAMDLQPSFGKRDPDRRGYYGEYGGRFVPETLVAPVADLEAAYLEARGDEAFRQELAALLRDYVGRPTPLYEATH